MESPPKKTAVVLFNLGGPDALSAVRPFLFRLFNDRAILGMPALPRFLLAQLIAFTRAPKTKAIYRQIGDKSPLLMWTEKQAAALEEKLSNSGNYTVFTCMRYWHPMTAEVVRKVKAFAPDHVVLLPLYPQFSTTTTGSSFSEWERMCKRYGLEAPTARICCYPTQPYFIASHVQALKTAYWKASEHDSPRILFSAHGLPKKIIEGGDPYQWQVEQTVAEIVKLLAFPELDYTICYQSRVGPLEWIGPSTEAELKRAGADKKPVVLVPVAFVSEHSETLVELDIEYAHLAKENGVTHYERVPALGVNGAFIEGLADLCRLATGSTRTCSHERKRLCPSQCSACPMDGANGAAEKLP